MNALRLLNARTSHAIQRAGIRALRQETWFLARVFRHAAALGLRGVVSFADPVPRRAADGTVVFPGHAGLIYQAKGGAYLGRSRRRSLLVLPDGTCLPPRAIAKIRADDRGHEYAERALRRHGAPVRRPGESGASWLTRALPAAGAVRLRVAGCHRYAFPLGTTRRGRAAVRIVMPRSAVVGPAGLVYPKRADRHGLAQGALW